MTNPTPQASGPMPFGPLRVVMVDVPGMLQDILVAELEGDPGLELRVARSTSGWLETIGRFRPEVVIAACSDAAAAWGDEAVDVYLVGPGGSAITRIALHPVREEMENVSLAQLVASIRAEKER